MASPTIKMLWGLAKSPELSMTDEELHLDIVNIGLHFFHKDVRLYAASCSEV